MQQTAQHGEYTLFTPGFAIATELHDAPFPGQFVLVQAFEFNQR